MHLNNIVIRDIKLEDASEFARAFKQQGWDKPASQYINYYNEQQEGKRVVMVAVIKLEDKEDIAGYLTILPCVHEGAFAGNGTPEICDFNVLEKYQRRGIGTVLMDHAEEYAGKISDTVTLGVGLHSGYGSAQRMYVKRGYIPDGTGVWYKNKVLGQYESCVNDDDLILYMSKKIDKK